MQGSDRAEAGARTALEDGIAEWRAYLRRRQAIHAVDADELEDHLRSQTSVLVAAGLTEDEAFLIAVKRIGALDELSREFAREHSERSGSGSWSPPTPSRFTPSPPHLGVRRQPHKVAALGENIILLVTLGWSAVLYGRFLAGRARLATLERWQTGYLPVYALWAWVVVLAFRRCSPSGRRVPPQSEDRDHVSPRARDTGGPGGCPPGPPNHIPSRSGEVEAVEVHDLRPGGDEVVHELLLRVVAGVDLGEGAELGVGAKTRSTRVPVHLSAPVARSRPS